MGELDQNALRRESFLGAVVGLRDCKNSKKNEAYFWGVGEIEEEM